MTKMSKDCNICVYNGVCLGRKYDSTITDCCVPEAKLRELQANAKDAAEFAYITNSYIRHIKNKSLYWTRYSYN